MLEIGCCGDDCNYCPRYLAAESGDEARLREVAAIWQIVGWSDTLETPGKMACHGCATLEECMLGIRHCAIEKGVENCGKCREYPCERMLKIFENIEKKADFCRGKLSAEDYALFQRAFFSKKKRLDKIHEDAYSGSD